MILFACIPAVVAVCPTCHGSASLFGCTGNPNTCPFLTDIVTNAAAIAGSGTSGLVVSRILPLWVSRLLSKDKLSVVTALAQRSRSGTAAYDLKDKSDYEIRKAVRTGRCPKDEAIDHVELVRAVSAPPHVGVIGRWLAMSRGRSFPSCIGTNSW